MAGSPRTSNVIKTQIRECVSHLENSGEVTAGDLDPDIHVLDFFRILLGHFYARLRDVNDKPDIQVSDAHSVETFRESERIIYNELYGRVLYRKFLVPERTAPS